MKKYSAILSILLAASLISIQAAAPGKKTIKVQNARQFLDAIGPDTIIEMAEGDYVLPELKADPATGMFPALKNAEHLEYIEHYRIKGVRNLTITGRGKSPSHIVFKNTLTPVLEFDKSHSVTIENVRAGHVPAGSAFQGCGETTSPVFRFSESGDIAIRNCKMYGSGNWGIEAFTVKNLTCTGSEIYDCNIGIVSIVDSSGIAFENCKMYNNTTGTFWFSSFINVSGSEGIVFRNCVIRNNTVLAGRKAKFYYSPEFTGFMVSVISYDEKKKSGPVVLQNCTVTGNSFAGMSKSPDQVKIVGGTVADNKTVTVPLPPNYSGE